MVMEMSRVVREREVNQIQMSMPGDPVNQPITERSWEKKSLLEKVSDTWHERHRDPVASKYTDLASITYFWFTLLTWIYLFITVYIPVHYSHWSSMSRYYLKVVAWFIFIQISANFLAVKFFRSSLVVTDDRPHELVDRGANGVISRNGGLQKDQFDASDRGVTPGDSRLTGRYCSICQMQAPYRTHHCIVCKVCILRRDHHCFFTGTCIGHYNQRYFTIMCVYITIGCTWGMLELVRNMSDTFVPTAEAWDYFLPTTCFHWLVGWISFRHMLMMWQAYSLWWMGFTTLGFTSWNFMIIALGKTSHEVRSNVRIRCLSDVSDRFRMVFGAFWGTNFLFPSVLIFRQENDGTKWPDVRKY